LGRSFGSARVQARNWRLMAFGSLALSMGLPAAWSGNRPTAASSPGWCRSTSSARPRPSRPQWRTMRRAIPRSPGISPTSSRSSARCRLIPSSCDRTPGLRLHHHLGLAGAQRLRSGQ
jgi:type IV secretion system protein VirB5